MGQIFLNNTNSVISADLSQNSISVIITNGNDWGLIGENDFIRAVLRYGVDPTNRKWYSDTSDVPAEIRTLLSQFEIVNITARNGQTLTIDRTSGSPQAWLANPLDNENNGGYLKLYIEAVVTAEDASILAGTINKDLTPDTDGIHSIGSSEKRINEIFSETSETSEARVTGSEGRATITHTGSDVALTLPTSDGRIATVDDISYPAILTTANTAVQTNVKLRSESLSLLKIVRLDPTTEANAKTQILCAILPVAQRLITNQIEVGVVIPTANFVDSGGFNTVSANNFIVRKYGTYAFLVEFDSINKTEAQFHTFFESLELNSLASGINSALLKQVAAIDVGAENLYLQGERQPLSVVKPADPDGAVDNSTLYRVGDKWTTRGTNKVWVLTAIETDDEDAVWEQIASPGIDLIWSGNVTSGTHSLISGKQFDDYQAIVVELVDDEADYLTMTIPIQSFTFDTNRYWQISNTQAAGNIIKYTSNTSFTATGTNGGAFTAIYGIKL